MTDLMTTTNPATDGAGSDPDMTATATADARAEALEVDHRSTAAIAGHPLHPSVVPLPIGMLAAAALSDVAHAIIGDRFFARASRWLLRGTVVTGAPAAALGAVDFSTIRAARQPIGVAHAAGNTAILLMTILSLVLRRGAPHRVPGPAMALTLLASALVVVTGCLGGELSYRKRIGVVPLAER